MTLVAERPASGEQQKPPTVPPPTQKQFEDAIKAARKDWQNSEIVTTKDMQRAYGDAVQAYKQNVMSGKMGPVTRARRNELLDDLERHTAALNDTSLFALRNGVSRSYATGVNTALPTVDWLAQVQRDGGASLQGVLPGYGGVVGGDQVSIQTLAQGYAERELVSYLARTNASGLTLSDAVWGASDPFKKGITGLVEEAVVTGMSARDLAKQIDALDPTRPIRPSSQAVIDDLNLKYKGIGQDISWEAVRLARTEVNTAGREGTVVGHSVSPVLEGFKWHRSGRVYDCKICDGLSKGIVRGVQVGTSQGVYMPEDVPVGHPNCRCYLTPEVPTREETMQQLEEWRADPASQPAIEDWYQKLTGNTVIPPGQPPAPPGGALPPPRLPTVKYEDVGPAARRGMEQESAQSKQRLNALEEERRQLSQADEVLWANKRKMDKAEFQAALDASDKRHNEIHSQIRGEYDALKQAQREWVYAEEPAKIGKPAMETVRGRKMTASEVPEYVTKGHDELAKIVGPNVVDGKTVDLAVMGSDDSSYASRRSYYNQGTGPRGRITLHPKDPSVSTVVHETGHWVEENANLGDEITAEVDRRTEGELYISMNEATKKAGLPQGYRPHEKTKPDKFFHPYLGKFYPQPNAHEFLSMAVEEMYTDPAALAAKDPETFDFVLQMLRRRNGVIPAKIVQAEQARLAASAVV